MWRRDLRFSVLISGISAVLFVFTAPAGADDFDGGWNGALTATDSLMGCAGSKFPITLEIRSGRITGSVRLPVGGAHGLRGTVTPDGRLKLTAAGDRSHARSASQGMTALKLEMTGVLADRRGTGEWWSNILGDCDGVFEVTRR